MKFLKPELDFGISPILLVVMFFGLIIYFGYCVRYVDGIKELKER